MKQPRILILTVYYHPIIGGVETHARDLANFLQKKGHDVKILTRKIDPESPSQERMDGVIVYRIPPPGGRSTLRKWLMIPIATIVLIRLGRSFDLIYCPGYQGIGIAALVAGKLLRCPVILQAGNLGVLSCRNWDQLLARWNIGGEGYLISKMKRIVQRFYASATAFACICKEIEKEALDCNIPPSKIRYLPNSVDCEKYRPPKPGEREKIRREERWPVDRVVCIFVGRLSIEKGILDLLDAWSIIANSNAILVVVGPDMSGHQMDVGPVVRKRVTQNQMMDNVILYGPSTDVPRLLLAADVFVQPSHYEAFPISVIEAMAAGLPIVASKVGGVVDYLSDGENALFCEPRNPENLAAKIRCMIENMEFRNRLGGAARRTAVRYLDDQAILGSYAKWFSEIATGYTE